ncbi:MAG: mgtE-like transporter [Actinomycetota bacterium]|nr:mgtE-like transporter [Actinomycetota bacterium]
MARPPRRDRAEPRSAAPKGTSADDKPARRRAKGGAKPAEVEAKGKTKAKTRAEAEAAGSASGRRSWRRDSPPDAAERARRSVLVRIQQGRPRLIRRLLGLLGPSADGARQSMVALVLNSATSLAAGAVLGSITGTFERLPGLLVLVPAAIGLRGNVFSALGNRLSTAIHVGTFRLSLRPQTVMGQNVAASLVLTLSLSLALAVVAKVVAVALGVMDTISVFDLALISVLGGLLASVVVLVATVALAAGSVRFGWDLDNVTAPLVSTLGDVLTLPALWAASLLVGEGPADGILGAALSAASIAVFVVAWRSNREVLRQVVRESAPILLTAACLSTMAGIAIEKQLGVFSTFPALLILFPAFISSAGALGGILSSRLSTKLHLGLMSPDPVPGREARLDGAMALVLGGPVYLLNGVGAHLVGTALGQASPGLPQMVAASLVGGLGAVLFVIAVAYYGTIAAFRFGVDPDTYGVPVVTSSVDFVGALCLILVIVALGIT